MPIFFRRIRRLEGDEAAGWIAMTDVFSLFAVVAIGVGAAQIDALTKILSSFPGDWQDVAAKSADLNRQIEVLKQELKNIKDKFEAVRTEKEQLADELRRTLIALTSEQATTNQLRSEVQTLKKELDELKDVSDRIKQCERELAECQTQSQRLSAENSALSVKVGSLEAEVLSLKAELAARVSRVNELSKSLDELKEKMIELTAERASLKKKIEKLELIIAATGRGEAQLRRELLGLDGELKRVVFVLDRSGSMDVKDNKTGRDRWHDAKVTIDAWLRHLAVDEAALIVFSSDIDVFPADGSWVGLKRDGPEPLLRGLSELTPTGGTNTLAALKRAYQYPGVDTIILFTDGAPDSGRDGGVGTSEDILNFVAAQRKGGSSTRVHVVGIGDYFTGRMRDFMLRLSSETGGSFIGR